MAGVTAAGAALAAVVTYLAAAVPVTDGTVGRTAVRAGSNGSALAANTDGLAAVVAFLAAIAVSFAAAAAAAAASCSAVSRCMPSTAFLIIAYENGNWKQSYSINTRCAAASGSGFDFGWLEARIVTCFIFFVVSPLSCVSGQV